MIMSFVEETARRVAENVVESGMDAETRARAEAWRRAGRMERIYNVSHLFLVCIRGPLTEERERSSAASPSGTVRTCSVTWMRVRG